MPSIDEQEETRERLLNTVKKEVKQLMEFSVSCKFVHEDNCCITSLCAAVDACLQHGLKPDMILNKRNSYQLVKKVSKECEAARLVVEICDGLFELHFQANNTKNSNNHDGTHKTSIIEKMFSIHDNNPTKMTNNAKLELIKSYQGIFTSMLVNPKLLWLKVALFEKKIDTIIEQIQKQAARFYYDYALMLDSVYGPMVGQLLAGPCALEFTRIKTCSTSWLVDHDAVELIRRHKIHSQLANAATNHGHSHDKHQVGLASSSHGPLHHHLPLPIGSNSLACYSPIKSPAIRSSIRNKIHNSSYNQNGHTNNTSMNSSSTSSSFLVSSYNPKEYVESLHQNTRTLLIYGKNHICVNKKNVSIPGYLSIHQSQSGLTLNWTPNDLLRTSSPSLSSPTKQNQSTTASTKSSEIIHIELEHISYMCCSVRLELESIVILVAHDGVQYPSFVFPLGTHLIQFLTCLDAALLPTHHLEPNGWEQILTNSEEPLILKKSWFEIEPTVDNIDSMIMSMETSSSVSPKSSSRNGHEISAMSSNRSVCETPRRASCVAIENRLKLKTVCEDMRLRIISRAFYGWYKHYKQAKTLKKHLLKLIIQPPQPESDENTSRCVNDSLLLEYIENKRPLDDSLWTKIRSYDEDCRPQFTHRLFYQLIYEQGIEDNELRRRVWPFILDVYPLDATDKEVESRRDELKSAYERVLAEWQPIEAHVRESERKSLAESSITPIKISSPDNQDDDDSGCHSDLTASSSMSSLTTASSNAGKFDRKKSGTVLSSTTSSLTPIRSSLLSSGGGQKGKIPKPKGKIRWSSPIANNNNNRNASHIDTTQDLDISSIIIKAHKKIKNTFFSKTTIPNKPPDTPKLVLRSPGVARVKPSDDSLCLELAQLLVANAIMRAKHQLEDEDSLKTTNPNKSIAFCSPQFDETKNSDVSQMNNCVVVNTTSSSDYHSSPFLQLESTHNNSSTASISLFKKNRRRIRDDNPTTSAAGVMATTTGSQHQQPQQQQPQECLSPILDDLITNNKDVVEAFAANMNRIDKDVLRCDRNYHYFMPKSNLDKLKNVIYSYIWETLDIGYVQGMCDLIAPFLVLFDDESLAYECFKKIMSRLEKNFLHSSEMDRQFEEMSFLVQVLDTDLDEYMRERGDYTQFYFTYRWFLLEFKREFSYEEIFGVWETMWAAKHTLTEHFHLFVALALVETYRDIIVENQMDFTNIIKFFNEMNEKHGAKEILSNARQLVDSLTNIVFDRN